MNVTSAVEFRSLVEISGDVVLISPLSVDMRTSSCNQD